MRKLLQIALALLLTVLPVHSATYYVDLVSGADTNNGTAKATPWLHAPGMNGCSNNCASYSHSAGDHFIFKGGQTCGSVGTPCWTTSAWSISNSGSSGNPDYYGVDKTWFAGGSWTPPIIDGGSEATPLNPFIYVTGSYITFDGWELRNITPAGSGYDSYAIEFRDNHDLTVENMVLPVETRIALYFLNTTGTTVNNFLVTGNDISAAEWGIAFGVAASSSVTNAPSIHDNVIHDLHDQIAQGAHVNAIIIFGGGTDATQYIQSPAIYNNRFYGDFSKYDSSAAGMTAMIFLENNIAGTINVYNNHGTYTATTGGYFTNSSLQAGSPATNVHFYNNSFLAPDSNWYGFAYVLGFGGASSFGSENNIFSGGTDGYYIGDTGSFATLASDYDIFYNQAEAASCWIGETGGAGCQTYAQFVAQGFEGHGKNTNPLFVSSANLHLTLSSPAIHAGANLSSVFTKDADGNTRPSIGAWDMGSFQYINPSVPNASLPLMLF